MDRDLDAIEFDRREVAECPHAGHGPQHARLVAREFAVFGRQQPVDETKVGRNDAEGDVRLELDLVGHGMGYGLEFAAGTLKRTRVPGDEW